jgi:predicted transcriptional regulator of viral defense system
MEHSNEVSTHEVRIYRALSDGQWMTSQQIADTANVAPRTARAYALRLVKLGVLEEIKTFPGHRYRFSNRKISRAYAERIERAAEALGMKER